MQEIKPTYRYKKQSGGKWKAADVERGVRFAGVEATDWHSEPTFVEVPVRSAN
jgi:hypothetical protein